ncbi:hypothetical protein BC938DRAFT_483077 [Jimgerdemannia flammicorona]|uniref:Uncharacterized protein n=1 Tax=Jimgerdemannia flammicorona TaxID=994334 RepID=A0A433QVZ5_9FUNG|nr:hypothetical protein BC938DRAFT_483077 [Jimgerdemannia flammicorona]
MGSPSSPRMPVLKGFQRRRSKEHANKVDGIQRIFAGDERDELGDALLDTFFGLLGNLGVLREGTLHDAGDAGSGRESRGVDGSTLQIKSDQGG